MNSGSMNHRSPPEKECILRLLSPEELKGVLAHEIAHIANRDILIQTVAGVMASTIVSIANFMQFAAIFGMGRSSEDGEGGGSNPLMAIVLAILAPIAASLIQFAISRSREYLADASGARYCGQPLALAAALGKLQSWNQRIPMQNGNPTTAEMFIVAPLFGGGICGTPMPATTSTTMTTIIKLPSGCPPRNRRRRRPGAGSGTIATPAP